MMDAARLKFTAGPPSLPPGAEVAVLDGDPTKPGPFAITYVDPKHDPRKKTTP